VIVVDVGLGRGAIVVHLRLFLRLSRLRLCLSHCSDTIFKARIRLCGRPIADCQMFRRRETKECEVYLLNWNSTSRAS
jgi:hypothetical protein